jgi:hypothetical protein
VKWENGDIGVDSGAVIEKKNVGIVKGKETNT